MARFSGASSCYRCQRCHGAARSGSRGLSWGEPTQVESGTCTLRVFLDAVVDDAQTSTVQAGGELPGRDLHPFQTCVAIDSSRVTAGGERKGARPLARPEVT
eukprot:3191295-Rhodomonas_salina.1